MQAKDTEHTTPENRGARAGESKGRKHTFSHSPGEDAAKIERIAGHTAGLVEDLKSWFELKIEFVVLEFKEEIRSAGLQFAYHAGFIAVMLIAALFALTALAFGLGAWLGHPGWGFLAVTGLLVVVAFVMKWIGDNKKKEGKATSHVHQVKDEQQKLPPAPSSARTTSNGHSQKEPALLETPQPSSPIHGHSKPPTDHGKD